LDFRTKAVIGYNAVDPRLPPYPSSWISSDVEASGWSKVQTFTMPGKPSSVPLQTATFPPVTFDGSNGQQQTPSQTQPPNSVFSNPFFMLGTGVLLGGAIVVIVMTFLKRYIKAPTYPDNSTQINTDIEL
jgi:hypothetical protein